MNIRPTSTIRRRDFLSTLAGAGALAMAPSVAFAAPPRPGRLKQGLCRGVFNGSKLDMDAMCREAARLGAVGFDLVGPESFETLKKHGLTATMLPGGASIKQGINDKQYHAARAFGLSLGSPFSCWIQNRARQKGTKMLG
jgi:hydroxypyruvate isomerase